MVWCCKGGELNQTKIIVFAWHLPTEITESVYGKQNIGVVFISAEFSCNAFDFSPILFCAVLTQRVKIFYENIFAVELVDNIKGKFSDLGISMKVIVIFYKIAIYISVWTGVIKQPIFALFSKCSFHQNIFNILHHIIENSFIMKILLCENISVPKT